MSPRECINPDDSQMYLFLITGDGRWSIRSSADKTYGTIVDSGQSSAIHSGTSGNTLSVMCNSASSGDHLMFAINGTTVANLTEPIGSPASRTWGPTIALCSCAGVSDADYTQMVVSSVGSGP